jgi:hypothetical protein
MASATAHRLASGRPSGGVGRAILVEALLGDSGGSARVSTSASTESRLSRGF